MAKSTLGQTRPLANTLSVLDRKLLSPEDFSQDFPDPLSLYSLYCVISKRQKCNKVPYIIFRPFKGRDCLEENDTWGDHLYWIRVLDELLGERVAYSNSNHRAKLTPFGKYVYPALMDGFLRLYKQNERLESLKTSWRSKYGDNDFKGFSP